eukprot:m.129054 g.129054  ORF g.129054 m.129054 type:complete len:335 (+) comp22305_c0_seq1:853-1857(+)
MARFGMTMKRVTGSMTIRPQAATPKVPTSSFSSQPQRSWSSQKAPTRPMEPRRTCRARGQRVGHRRRRPVEASRASTEARSTSAANAASSPNLHHTAARRGPPESPRESRNRQSDHRAQTQKIPPDINLDPSSTPAESAASSQSREHIAARRRLPSTPPRWQLLHAERTTVEPLTLPPQLARDDRDSTAVASVGSSQRQCGTTARLARRTRRQEVRPNLPAKPRAAPRALGRAHRLGRSHRPLWAVQAESTSTSTPRLTLYQKLPQHLSSRWPHPLHATRRPPLNRFTFVPYVSLLGLVASVYQAVLRVDAFWCWEEYASSITGQHGTGDASIR